VLRKRTVAGEYETLPAPNVTTTVEGLVLRRVTVRAPTVRRDVGQPFSVVSLTVFQSFVTVASRVTRKDACFEVGAPTAVPARNASRQARPRPQVTLK
jgi:hypothetical protein